MMNKTIEKEAVMS